MDISIFTLRYYEKERLLCPSRDSNNQRSYSETDAKWAEFIKRLKETGMSIKDIRCYSDLREQGDITMTERMEMLVKHRIKLRQEIETLQKNLGLLDDKIDFYRGAIEEKNGL